MTEYIYPLKLKPLPSQHQKSFYGKALVYTLKDGTKILRSYDTIVASKTPDGTIHRHWNGKNPVTNKWSPTTGRHIKAFCGLNKSQFKDLLPKGLPFDIYELD